MNLDNPLPFADNSFDVVHTHQVLVHLSDPVSALIEMRRACKPGGFIASREGDIAASVTFPDLPEMQKFREVYEKFIRTGGAEPRAGRYLRYWALQAGFRDERITYTSTPMLYAGPETTRWSWRCKLNCLEGMSSAQNLFQRDWYEKDAEGIGKAWLK